MDIERAREAVASILREESLTDEVSRNRQEVLSYFNFRARDLVDQFRCHPLGFFVAAEQIDSVQSLRFHIWPRGFASPAVETGEEIHDHVYKLNSFIVVGALTHEVFDVKDTPDSIYELHEAVYTQNGSSLRSLNRPVDLRTRETITYSTGEIYRLCSRTIHRASPAILPTATLVLTISDNLGGNPRVIKRRGTTSTTKFERRLLDQSQTRMLNEVLALADLLAT